MHTHPQAKSYSHIYTYRRIYSFYCPNAHILTLTKRKLPVNLVTLTYYKTKL